MTKIVPNFLKSWIVPQPTRVDTQIDIATITAARVRAEKQFDSLHALEHIYQLLPLAKKLQSYRKLFDRHGLVLAFETENTRYPAIYLIKRDHSRWCRIWRCGSDGGFRLDADEKFSTYSSDYSLPWSEVMKRDLSGNIDIAVRCVVGMLERDELRFGNAYLPSGLHDIDDVTLPTVPQHSPAPAVAALPPPTLELNAIEVRPVTPLALRPVGLVPRPKPIRDR